MQHCGTQTIETTRLLLRKLTMEDAEAIFQNWTSDENVTTYLRWPTHSSIEVTKRVLMDWIAQYPRKEFYQWGIILKETMEPIGTISTVDYDERIEMVHIGYCIGSRWWHQGIMSEALQAVIQFFFETVKVNRIESQHDPKNPHSGNVMKHCGMMYEGTHRQADWSNQGICDSAVYAILRADYQASTCIDPLRQTTTLLKQYQNDERLTTRISIHERYSTNKQGFGNWLFANYALQEHMEILELGCGTADIWKAHIQEVPQTTHVILSDISQGMLENAKQALHQYEQVAFDQVDIQTIPYADESFDIVIANMMLYHVPNLQQALAEVQRVLKPHGVFYCATFGEHGIVEYVENLWKEHAHAESREYAFTLENGAAQLQPYFQAIQKHVYEDALAIDHIEDLMTYLDTLDNMTWISKIPRQKIREVLQKQCQNGVLYIPKSYGMFAAYKHK